MANVLRPHTRAHLLPGPGPERQQARKHRRSAAYLLHQAELVRGVVEQRVEGVPLCVTDTGQGSRRRVLLCPPRVPGRGGACPQDRTGTPARIPSALAGSIFRRDTPQHGHPPPHTRTEASCSLAPWLTVNPGGPPDTAPLCWPWRPTRAPLPSPGRRSGLGLSRPPAPTPSPPIQYLHQAQEHFKVQTGPFLASSPSLCRLTVTNSLSWP